MLAEKERVDRRRIPVVAWKGRQFLSGLLKLGRKCGLVTRCMCPCEVTKSQSAVGMLHLQHCLKKRNGWSPLVGSAMAKSLRVHTFLIADVYRPAPESSQQDVFK